MQTRRPSSALAVSGEVSLSFQDELAATIHRAFEVAVEIAVVEVSKLVSQALGDVRDQMQETLRENTFLKTRLQSAELELDTARKGRKSTSPSAADVDIQQQNDLCQRHESQTKCESQSTGKADNSPTGQEDEKTCIYANGSERPDESFCEIREDGSVRSRDLGSTSISVHCRNLKSGPPHETLIPENQQMAQHCQDIHNHQNSPSVEQPVCKKEEDLEPQLGDASGEDGGDDENHLDEEEDDEDDDDDYDDEDDDIKPSCSFNSERNDEFEPDRLSLVQSKLLEDWRPDPDVPQCVSNENADAGPSRSLDARDMLSAHVGANPGFSVSFDALYQSVDRTHLVHPAATIDQTDVPTRIHQCKICGHSFSRASDLRRHHSHRHRVRAAKTESAGRPVKQQLFPPGCSPYHCNECGRDFNRMENLKTHLRIHTGERPYSCSVCGVRFRHSGALTRHFRIHTGEKPYVCGQCGKRFRNCGGLRFHQKSHTTDRHMVLNCV